LVAFVVLLITVAYVGSKARSLTLEEAQDKAVQIAHRWSAEVQSEMQVAMDCNRSLAQAMEGMKNRGVPNRDMMDGILKNILERYPQFLAVWTCWEPNAVDGKDMQYIDAIGHDATGRYIPYWNRLSGEIDVEPLADYDVPGKGDYYMETLRTNKEQVFDPVPFEVGGKQQLKTILAVPIRYEGKAVGVVGIDLPLLALQPIIDKVKLFDEGSGFMMANNGVFVAHPKPENVGRTMASFNFKPESMQAVKEGREATEVKVSPDTGKKTFYAFSPISVGFAEKKWSLATNVPENEITRPASRIFWQSMGIGVVAIAILGVAVWFVVGGISGPILNMATTIRQVARDRDLSIDVPVTSRDELGVMARELNNMMKALRDSFAMVDDAAGHVHAQSSDVAKRATANRDRAQNEEKQMAVILATVGDMGETASQVQQASSQQADRANEAFTRVTELIENMKGADGA
jgi:methyl-accepting chemotaxis protein